MKIFSEINTKLDYYVEDFSFFIISYCNAYGLYSFQKGLYFRAAAPAYSFSPTVAISCFHNFWIRTMQVLKLFIFYNIIFFLALQALTFLLPLFIPLL